MRRGLARVQRVLVGALGRARPRDLRRGDAVTAARMAEADGRRRHALVRPPRRPRPRLADRHARRREGARGALPALPGRRRSTRWCTCRGSVSPAIERAPDPHVVRAAAAVGRRARYRHYLPLFPTAIEQFDLDRRTTSSSARATARPSRSWCTGRAPHVCYCHSPMRYAWDQFDAYFGPAQVGAARVAAAPAGAGAAGAVGSRHGAAASTALSRILITLRGESAGTIIAGRPSCIPLSTRPFTGRTRPGARSRSSSSCPPWCPTSASTWRSRGRAQLGAPLTIVGRGPDEARLRALAQPAGGDVDVPRLARATRRSASSTGAAGAVAAARRRGLRHRARSRRRRAAARSSRWPRRRARERRGRRHRRARARDQSPTPSPRPCATLSTRDLRLRRDPPPRRAFGTARFQRRIPASRRGRLCRRRGPP